VRSQESGSWYKLTTQKREKEEHPSQYMFSITKESSESYLSAAPLGPNAITMPRRSVKTSNTIVNFIVWLCEHDKNLEFTMNESDRD